MKILVLFLVALSLPASNLISNGGFESGSTASWSTTSQAFPNTTGSCNNGYAAQSTATGCQSGINPISGTYAAYASVSFPAIPNDTGEWINSISQDFFVPQNIATATLTWSDSFVYSGSGSFRGVNVGFNILSGSTSLLSVQQLTNPGNNGQSNWTNRNADLTAILQAHAGETLTLRFFSLAFYDTRGTGSTTSATSATSITAGLDNVSLDVTTANPQVPEPSTLATAALVLIALAHKLRR